MTPRNIALVLLFAALPCSAQQPALTVDAILAHIRDNVAEFKQSIPAFIADETVLSQRFQSGVLAEQVHLDSSFEMQRSSPDGPMHETRHIKLANGVPPKDPHKVRLPWA
ncbi:MAG: hypothetical protein M3O31_16635, partial [Acidobacteriota bacterium]|nr:hypothetical protein [Acidobacteriota bacterium]